MSNNIDINFSFEELAGLYFISTAGFISIVLQNTPESDENYKQIELEWREQIMNLREAGNYEQVVAKIDSIRGLLAEKAKELEASKPSE